MGIDANLVSRYGLKFTFVKLQKVVDIVLIVVLAFERILVICLPWLRCTLSIHSSHRWINQSLKILRVKHGRHFRNVPRYTVIRILNLLVELSTFKFHPIDLRLELLYLLIKHGITLQIGFLGFWNFWFNNMNILLLLLVLKLIQSFIRIINLILKFGNLLLGNLDLLIL